LLEAVLWRGRIFKEEPEEEEEAGSAARLRRRDLLLSGMATARAAARIARRWDALKALSR
jgi:hypothetical protein